MKVITMPDWIARKRGDKAEDYPAWERRQEFKLPPDLEQDLARTLDEPFGAPIRTAQIVADELAHLRGELTNARELVKAGEAKELELVAERDRRIDEEIAAKKAAHDAEVAELEGLRPSTGEPA